MAARKKPATEPMPEQPKLVEPKTYTVKTENGLRLRSQPSKDGKTLAVLPFGTEITEDATREAPKGWIAADGGYVMAKFVK